METPATSETSGASDVVTERTSRLAIASLILGLVPFCAFTGIAGVVCGVKARTQIRSSGGKLGGENMARAGIALSMLMILFSIPVLAGLVMPVKFQKRLEVSRSTHRLKSIVVAQQTWTADNGGKMPPASWTTALSLNSALTNVPLSAYGGMVGYAFNIAVAGLDAVEVNANTVVFFETDRVVSNLSGGRDLLRRPDTFKSRICVSLADGTIRTVEGDQVDSLRWNP